MAVGRSWDLPPGRRWRPGGLQRGVPAAKPGRGQVDECPLQVGRLRFVGVASEEVGVEHFGQLDKAIL